MYNIEELKIRLLSELKEIAEELGVKNFKTLKKDDLVYAILDQQAITPETSLPKKKPAKAEAETSETSGNTTPPAASQKEKKPKEVEKSKFKRQNVTEIPREPEAKQAKASKPIKKERPSANSPVAKKAAEKAQETSNEAPKKDTKNDPSATEEKSTV